MAKETAEKINTGSRENKTILKKLQIQKDNNDKIQNKNMRQQRQKLHIKILYQT